MRKDWGYSALIENGGKRILFDTGNSPGILAQNAKAKGVDLSKLDFLVMSHRHGDHRGDWPTYTRPWFATESPIPGSGANGKSSF